MPRYPLVSLIVAVVGSMSMTQAEPANTASENQNDAVVPTAIRGLVVDERDHPIVNATISTGMSRKPTSETQTLTDRQGKFILTKCNPGSLILTAQAEGFAPQFQDVLVKSGAESIVFRLDPSSELRVKVVDVDRKPIAGARFEAVFWHGHAIVPFGGMADDQGVFVWKGAPADEFELQVGAEGFRTHRTTLACSGQEQRIGLDRQVNVTGRVVDAKTGQPVPRFRVIEGQVIENTGELVWARSGVYQFQSGQYSLNSNARDGSIAVRIEAPGYKVEKSLVFRVDEGPLSIDFKLESAPPIQGIVVDLGNHPIPGAEVCLGDPGYFPSLENGRFTGSDDAFRAKADRVGKFSLPSHAGEYCLIAIDETGYAVSSGDAFRRSGQLILKPWGRIRGQVEVGGKLAGGQQLSMQASFDTGLPNWTNSTSYQATTDVKGRFMIERVFPGTVKITRSVDVPIRPGFVSHVETSQRSIEIVGGEMTRVTIGDRGRPVIGKFAINPPPTPDFDWRKNSPVQLYNEGEVLPEADNAVKPRIFAADDWSHFFAKIDQEGRFRFDNVPQGEYTLAVRLDGVTMVPGDDVREGEIGGRWFHFSMPAIPGGESDDPLELGSINIRARPRLRLGIGDPAPDFDVPRLTQGSIKLADYAGKVVLLNFWTLRRIESLAAIPVLKEIQRLYGNDPRLVIIGVSCDPSKQISEEFALKNRMSWTQGFAGNEGRGVVGQLALKNPLANFLIGQDGKILAKDVHGEELKQAVAKALKSRP